MVSTDFTFGSLTLPEDVQDKARTLCGELKLTPTQLFYKWEAWALNRKSSTDIPTLTELDQLATSIREKAGSKAVFSPASRSKSRPTASPLYTPAPTPTAINIDDFFNYVPTSESVAVRTSDDDAKPRKSPDMLPSSPQLQPDPGSPSVTKAPETTRKAVMRDEDTSNEDMFTLPRDDDAETAYTQRAGSGRIEAALAPVMKPETRAEQNCTSHVISIRLAVDTDARYMNDDLISRVEAFRARVKTLGAALVRRVAHVNELDEVPKFSPEAFFVKSPNITRAVGRIRAELDDVEGTGKGRINEKSVLLESVDGNLVKLDLTRLKKAEQPLFLTPGSVIAIEGVNTNGRVFDVHNVYDNCIEDFIKDESQLLVEDKESAATSNHNVGGDTTFINIIAASGPFTTMSTLQYRPLDDLMQIVERNKPDIVFIAGPFVDAKHELIVADLPVPFEHVFERRVLARLVRTAQKLRQEGHRCNFVVLPSLDDVHHEFVCPQPAFRWPEGMTPDESILFLSNPGVIEISAFEGALRAAIGVTSLPCVWDVSSDHICWNTDRYQAIASHFIKQRSFYPTFPPSADVPLDSSLLDGLVIPTFKSAPSVDLLLLPSRRQAFAKLVDAGAIAVNPGLLCRGNGGGTYAEILLPLHPSDRHRPREFNESHVEVNVVRL